MRYLRVHAIVLTEKEGGVPVVLHERGKHQKERVRRRQTLEVGGAVVVDHDLLESALLEQVLALARRGEVGERRFALLQAPSVEAVGAVDVDGAADVVDVVRQEGAAIHHQEAGSLLQLTHESVRVQSTHTLGDERPLQRRALSTRTRWQTHTHGHGFQLATLRPRAGSRPTSWSRPRLTQAAVQRQLESVPWPSWARSKLAAHQRRHAAGLHTTTKYTSLNSNNTKFVKLEELFIEYTQVLRNLR